MRIPLVRRNFRRLPDSRQVRLATPESPTHPATPSIGPPGYNRRAVSPPQFEVCTNHGDRAAGNRGVQLVASSDERAGVEVVHGPAWDRRGADRLRRSPPCELGRRRRDAGRGESGGFPHVRGDARLPRRGLHVARNHREDRRLRRPGHATGADRAVQVGPGPHERVGAGRHHAARRLHPGGRFKLAPQAVPGYTRTGGRPRERRGCHGCV